MDLSRFFLRVWQRRGWAAWLLLPFAGLFVLLAALRRLVFYWGILKQQHLPVPVVVVGNIIVGGSGKTPLTLWLVEQLRAAGWQPGIISRGYAADARPQAVCEVHADSLAGLVGDEPLLLRRRTGVPVFVGRDRAAAGRALLAAYPQCDVLLSDDGLQHYRLGRDVEIAVLDGRGLMNGWRLPAGPLRESPQRLARVTALVLNGTQVCVPVEAAAVPHFVMQLEGRTFQRLDDPAVQCLSAELAGLRLAAVCGIAVPERFFRHLEALGLRFSRHVFPDHHRYSAEDLSGIVADVLLMTEKDAVKCRAFSGRAIWVLPVTAHLVPDTAGDGLIRLIEPYLVEKMRGSPTA